MRRRRRRRRLNLRVAASGPSCLWEVIAWCLKENMGHWIRMRERASYAYTDWPEGGRTL